MQNLEDITIVPELLLEILAISDDSQIFEMFRMPDLKLTIAKIFDNPFFWYRRCEFITDKEFEYENTMNWKSIYYQLIKKWPYDRYYAEGNVDVVDFLEYIFPNPPFYITRKRMQSAILSGNLDVVNYLYNQYGKEFDVNELLKTAATGKDVGIFRYFLSKGGDLSYQDLVVFPLAINNSYPILEFLFSLDYSEEYKAKILNTLQRYSFNLNYDSKNNTNMKLLKKYDWLKPLFLTLSERAYRHKNYHLALFFNDGDISQHPKHFILYFAETDLVKLEHYLSMSQYQYILNSYNVKDLTNINALRTIFKYSKHIDRELRSGAISYEIKTALKSSKEFKQVALEDPRYTEIEILEESDSENDSGLDIPQDVN